MAGVGEASSRSGGGDAGRLSDEANRRGEPVNVATGREDFASGGSNRPKRCRLSGFSISQLDSGVLPVGGRLCPGSAVRPGQPELLPQWAGWQHFRL